MKKLMNYAAIAVTMIAFLCASTLNAQEWTKDQKEVWSVIENAWANWQEGDYDAAFANIHEKYIGWNIEDPLPTTKDKWVKSITMMKDFVTFNYYDIEPARILVYDDVAVVHYYYSQSFTFTKDDESTDYNYKGKNAEFLIKEKGEWYLIGDMTFWESKK